MAQCLRPVVCIRKTGFFTTCQILTLACNVLYVAPSGEAALGSVAFMHRPSAMDVPEAPLGH